MDFSLCLGSPGAYSSVSGKEFLTSSELSLLADLD